MAADHMTVWLYLSLFLFYFGLADGRNSKEFFITPEAFSSSQVASTEQTLRRLMRIQCLPNIVSVSFSQEEMLALGILPNQISFVSPRCEFRSNATHYHSQVIGTGCNSTLSIDSALNKQVLNNAVVLAPPPHPSMDSEVIPIDDDEDAYEALSSGSGDDSSADLQTITIPFKCDLTQSSTSQPAVSSSLLKGKHNLGASPDLHVNSSYEMMLFDNEELNEPLADGHVISAGSNIYVKIKSNEDGEMNRFFLHDCYYESVREDNSYLIRNGCPIEPSVSFLDDKQEEVVRLFSFKAHRLHRQGVFLRCDLQPCTTNIPHRKDIPKCVSQMYYCASKPKHKKKQTSVMWPYELVVTEETTPLAYRSDCKEQLVQTCHCEESVAVASDLKHGGVIEIKLWVVILISIAAFSIGSVSVISLWCIHNCTRVQQKKTAKPACDTQANSYEPTAQCRLMKDDAHNAPQAL